MSIIRSLSNLVAAFILVTMLVVTATATARIDDGRPATDPVLNGMSVTQLQNLMRSEQRECPKLNCDDTRLYVRDLLAAESKELGVERRASLRAKAREQAVGIWPDTVLEGPYHVQFRMRVDQLQELSLDGAPIGYRVMFSDKSWNIERCNPPAEGRKGAWYRNCETGRIYDSVFVLQGLRVSFRDEFAPARFFYDGAPGIPVGSPIQTDFSLNPNKKHLMSGFSRLNLPIENGSCDPQTVENTLASHLTLVADLIYDERGLRICDENEYGRACYEESALATLLTNLTPGRAGFETDLGYQICEGNAECDVQFRVQCNGVDLSLELQ